MWREWGYAQPRCPQYASLDIGFDEIDKEGAFAAMSLVGVPLATKHEGGTCHACGHEWDYDGGPSSNERPGCTKKALAI
jgi:hypothetical protein